MTTAIDYSPGSTAWRDLPPVEQPFEPSEGWTPSQTFLRHHDACDRAGYLYAKYRSGAGSAELNRGGIFHEVVDRLLRIIVAEREPSIAPEIGRDVLYEVMRESPAAQVPANERDALRYMVDHWCRGTYFPNTIIGVETTFTLEITLPDGRTWKVLARADMVEDLGGGVCQITDWKTAFPPTSDEFTRQSYDRQGNPRWAGNYQLNMLATLAHFGVASDGLPLGDFNRYKLVLGFPRELRADGITTRSIEVMPLQLDHYREDLALQLQRLVGNLETQKWQATPGAHCRICPAEAECPLPRYLSPERQFANLETAEELREAAGTANYMAGRAERLKSKVRKAATELEKKRPGVLDLPNGDRGVSCGKDVAFVFIPKTTEVVRDKLAWRQEVEDAANEGRRPDWAAHHRISESTDFVKRRIG